MKHFGNPEQAMKELLDKAFSTGLTAKAAVRAADHNPKAAYQLFLVAASDCRAIARRLDQMSYYEAALEWKKRAATFTSDAAKACAPPVNQKGVSN